MAKGAFEYVVQLDANGDIVSGSSGGTSATDDGAFTAGSSSVTPIGAVYQATPDNVDDGDVGAPRMTADRVIMVGGNVAHDAADSGNPVKIGGKANSSLPTAVAAADRVDAWLGLNGQVIIGGLASALGDGANVAGIMDSSGNPRMIAAGMFNGSTFDRMRGDTTNGLDVDVTRSALPTGAATSANQDTANTALAAIETAAELIDDTVKTEDVAHSAGDKGIAILAVRRDADTSLVDTDGDYANLQVNTNGHLKVEVFSGELIPISGTVDLGASTNNIGDVDIASALPAGTNAIGKLLPPDIDVTAHTNYAKKYYTNSGAVTDGIIWSPAAGKRWHITTLVINVSAAATVTLEDDKSGGDEAIGKWEFAANSGVVLTFPEKYPWASGEDAADLTITTSAGNVYVTAVGYEV